MEEARGYGSFAVSGLGEVEEIEEIVFKQAIGEHARLQVKVWLTEESAKEWEKGGKSEREVQLLSKSGEKEEVLFCGLLEQVHLERKEGGYWAEAYAYSMSIKLDRKKKSCSYQKEARKYGELIKEIGKAYEGFSFLWPGEEKEKNVGQFLLQQEETDWAFLERVVSFFGYALVAEPRFRYPKLFVGLPKGRKEQEVKAVPFRLRKDFSPVQQRREKGKARVWQESEMMFDEIGPIKENYRLGDRLNFLGGSYVVASGEGKLTKEKGVWENQYVLKQASGCKVERKSNPNLAGLAIEGKVKGVRRGESKLGLVTDGEGEEEESWHMQPVYYAGQGKGYTGMPEKGDTLYLYFPTKEEEDRYVLGTKGAEYEKVYARAAQSVKAPEPIVPKKRQRMLRVRKRKRN